MSFGQDLSWVPVPSRTPAPLPTGPAYDPVGDQNRKLILLGAGIIGGLFVGRWGYEHLFVEGLETGERRTMVGFAAGVGVIAAAAWILGLDAKWWQLEPGAEALQAWLTGQPQPVQKASP